MKERDEIIATILTTTRYLTETGCLKLIVPTRRILAASTRLIVEKHLSADDSLQLTSAVASGKCYFISSDSNLNQAAMDEGLRAYDSDKEADLIKLRDELRRK
jgi:hypothetical protein